MLGEGEEYEENEVIGKKCVREIYRVENDELKGEDEFGKEWELKWRGW